MSLTRNLLLPLTGLLTAGAPLFDPFGASETIPVSTVAAADRFFWHDPLNGAVTGPTPQYGSTAGADTNDPTVAASPSRLVYGADDFITWGTDLDALFSSASGFTIVQALGRNATDAAANRLVFTKTDTTAQTTLRTQATGGGALEVRVFYALDGSSEEQGVHAAALGSGRHVVAFSYNPTLAKGSRLRLYSAGVFRGGSSSTTGTATTLVIGTAAARVGMNSWGDTPVTESRIVAGYSRVLTDTEVADITTDIVNGGWTGTPA